MKIHSSAIVASGAKLGANVSVGPGAIIEANTEIGDETEIGAHAIITGHTTVGRRCRIFTGAVIGSAPQDLKYRGEKSFVRIGDENTIREYVTINPATEEGAATSIGSGNLIMAYSHVGHNCLVGDRNVLANNATLAGHVVIENNVVLGGLCAIHQFCRIGSFAIVGGCSKIAQDILPYSLSDGRPARIYWLNRIGLKRNNFSREAASGIEQVYRILLRSKLNLSQAVEKIKQDVPQIPEVRYILQFIAGANRGIALSRRTTKNETP